MALKVTTTHWEYLEVSGSLLGHEVVLQITLQGQVMSKQPTRGILKLTVPQEVLDKLPGREETKQLRQDKGWIDSRPEVDKLLRERALFLEEWINDPEVTAQIAREMDLKEGVESGTERTRAVEDELLVVPIRLGPMTKLVQSAITQPGPLADQIFETLAGVSWFWERRVLECAQKGASAETAALLEARIGQRKAGRRAGREEAKADGK